jgi:hypothetical protein
VPPVLLPGRDPGERAERACDRGSDDRRLRPDGEDVGADRRERSELAEEAGQPEEPRQEERRPGDERDVLTRDREQVVEAGGSEVPS